MYKVLQYMKTTRNCIKYYSHWLSLSLSLSVYSWCQPNEALSFHGCPTAPPGGGPEGLHPGETQPGSTTPPPPPPLPPPQRQRPRTREEAKVFGYTSGWTATQFYGLVNICCMHTHTQAGEHSTPNTPYALCYHINVVYSSKCYTVQNIEDCAHYTCQIWVC